MNRRGNIGLARFSDDYVGAGAFVATIIFAFILIICAAIYDGKRDDAKSRLEGQNFVNTLQGIDVPDGPGRKTAEKIVKIFPKNVPVKREIILTMLVSLKESGITSERMDDWIKIADVYLKRGAGDKSAASQQSENLPRDFYQQWEWSWFRHIAYYAYYIVLILGMLINLAAESSGSNERMVDLPWRKTWVWIFILFTLPIGFVFYAVSGVRLSVDVLKERRRRRERGEEHGSSKVVVLDPLEAARLVESQREDLQQQAIEIMDSENLEQSRENWKALYGTSRLARWENQMKQCEVKVKESREYLAKLGDKVRGAQERLANDQKSLKLIKTSKPSDGGMDDPMPDAEFKRLLSFPRVLAAEIYSDRISVWTKPVIFKHQGVRHDLGNYLIEVRDIGDNPKLSVKCIVSGRLDRRCKHLYGADSGGSFCFGDRSEHIYDLLRKGEYLGVIDLALQGIAYVNPSGRTLLPEFMEVPDENGSERADAA